MNTRSDAVPGSPSDAQVIAHPTSATRPLYWSVRRELWENRSIYVAPLAVAGLVLFSFLVSTIGLPARMRGAAALEPMQQQNRLAMPFSMAASVIIVTSIVVGAFYCLEALYGERRDRSILFWKSLPVSDLTTVLAKACIPLVVLPAMAFVTALLTQLLMLFLSSLILLVTGFDPSALWTRVPLFRMTLVMAYGVVVNALWHAPIFAWLLLVSAWARRLPLLWAVLPPVAIFIFEHIAFGTMHGVNLLCYRIRGAVLEGFDFKAAGSVVPVLLPLRFLGSPGLWSGLLFAAIFLAAALRLRRYREPI
jgi:ABC-2 type transport system permease protein